jgi:hypothetical protein
MGPCQGKTTAVTFSRRVLAGGDGLAGDDLVLRDLCDPLCSRVGDVHQDKRRSMAGGDGLRRPCRGARGRTQGGGWCSTVGWTSDSYRQ